MMWQVFRILYFLYIGSIKQNLSTSTSVSLELSDSAKLITAICVRRKTINFKFGERSGQAI